MFKISGRLIGVVGLKELRAGIENANSGNFPVNSPPTPSVTTLEDPEHHNQSSRSQVSIQDDPEVDNLWLKTAITISIDIFVHRLEEILLKTVPSLTIKAITSRIATCPTPRCCQRITLLHLKRRQALLPKSRSNGRRRQGSLQCE